MPVTTKCPGCGRQISAPDAAAGRKARCPHCSTVVDIPGSGHVSAGGHAPVQELAAALGHAGQGKASATIHAASALATATPTPQPVQVSPSSVSAPSATPPSTTRTSTAIDRMLAKTSPYGSLRLLAAIIYGAGIALAILGFLGGVTAVIVVSINGHPLWGVGAFAGALVASLIIYLAGRTINELIRLWADVGDRVRQTAQMIEDMPNRTRDE
jgi:hypothetical protein